MNFLRQLLQAAELEHQRWMRQFLDSSPTTGAHQPGREYASMASPASEADRYPDHYGPAAQQQSGAQMQAPQASASQEGDDGDDDGGGDRRGMLPEIPSIPSIPQEGEEYQPYQPYRPYQPLGQHWWRR